MMFQWKWTLFLIVDTVGHKFFGQQPCTFYCHCVLGMPQTKPRFSSEFQIIMFSINATVIHSLARSFSHLSPLHRLSIETHLMSSSSSPSPAQTPSSIVRSYPFSSRLMTSGTWIIRFCLDWYSSFSQLNNVYNRNCSQQTCRFYFRSLPSPHLLHLHFLYV